MAHIHIRREHRLGPVVARRLAARWADTAAREFGLACERRETADGDVVVFRRSGVSGRAEVTADQVTVEATLGFLLAGFARRIEAEIAGRLDGLLAAAAAEPPSGG